MIIIRNMLLPRRVASTTDDGAPRRLTCEIERFYNSSYCYTACRRRTHAYIRIYVLQCRRVVRTRMDMICVGRRRTASRPFGYLNYHFGYVNARVKEYKKSIFFSCLSLSLSRLYLPAQKVTVTSRRVPLYRFRRMRTVVLYRTRLSTTQRNYYVKTHARAAKKKKKK